LNAGIRLLPISGLDGIDSVLGNAELEDAELRRRSEGRDRTVMLALRVCWGLPATTSTDSHVVVTVLAVTEQEGMGERLS